MNPDTRRLRAWIVDPINYSGMAYYDLGLVTGLREHGVDAVLVGSDRPLIEGSTFPAMPVFVGTHGRRARWRRGLSYARSLVRLLAAAFRARPDVVHWQYLEVPTLDLLAIATLRLLGVAIVFTAHEAGPWTAGRVNHVVRRLVYLISTRIVVHNPETTAAVVHRYHVSPSKVAIVEHGDYQLTAEPEMDRLLARERLAIPDQAPVALFFGSLRPAKGLDLLIEAWPYVVAARPDALLLIAGPPFKSSGGPGIMTLIDSLDLAASVRTVIREIEPAEANVYYRAADVVVLPYRAIGTSGVLRYAYSSARPVVATSVGEHSRHVLRGATGWLVPAGDREALAGALVAALQDRNKTDAMGRAALAYANQQWSWAASALATAELYRSLVTRDS